MSKKKVRRARPTREQLIAEMVKRNRPEADDLARRVALGPRVRLLVTVDGEPREIGGNLTIDRSTGNVDGVLADTTPYGPDSRLIPEIMLFGIRGPYGAPLRPRPRWTPRVSAN